MGVDEPRAATKATAGAYAEASAPIPAAPRTTAVAHAQPVADAEAGGEGEPEAEERAKKMDVPAYTVAPMQPTPVAPEPGVALDAMVTAVPIPQKHSTPVESAPVQQEPMHSAPTPHTDSKMKYRPPTRKPGSVVVVHGAKASAFGPNSASVVAGGEEAAGAANAVDGATISSSVVDGKVSTEILPPTEDDSKDEKEMGLPETSPEV